MNQNGRQPPDERAEIDAWTNQIHEGNALDVLDQLPESSIHTCVTSPPYWGLRDYGKETENFWGSNKTCDHEWVEQRTPTQGGQNTDENPPDVSANQSTQQTRLRGREGISSAYCTKCGGWYGQLGLEPTLSQYVENIVAVGNALQRVLRADGSWWLNLGDTYAGGGGIAGKPNDYDDLHDDETYPDEPPAKHTRFERKTKLLVPHRVAIALEDAGWIVRSDAVWAKSNPMPSSVTDRLNETKEFVFHLTPQPDYWFDLDAIREPHADSSFERATNSYHGAKTWATDHLPGRTDTSQTHNFDAPLHPNGKNPGDVFDVAVAQCPKVHYATFPEKLIDSPIKASCPPRVCAECGTPYRRETTEQPLTLDIEEEPERPQTRRALSKARQAGLTNDHLRACRAVGFSDAGAGKVCQTGAGNNTEHVERLAAEAKDVLGGYFREFCGTRRVSTGWTSACECETDETRPGIVLDPFAGMGTTCRVAKRLGRRFIGVELNSEYVALAQENVGIDVSEPGVLTDDAQQGLTAYTDGGERQ